MTTITRPTFAVPGPRSVPLVGQLWIKARFARDPVGTLQPLFARYGPIVAFQAGGGIRIYSSDPRCPGSIAVYGPELLRQTRTQHDRFHQHPLTGPIYGRRSDNPRTRALNTFLVSLWGIENDEHRRQRRLMMPAFHKKRIETYRDDMVAITTDELNRWRAGERIDVADAMRGLTLRIATKTLFGEDGGATARSLGHDVFDAAELLSHPLTVFLALDWPGLPYYRTLNLITRFDQAMRDLVARRRAAGRDEGDVISMLLQARDEESGTSLTEEEVVSHVGALFAAGHETTANTLTWTIFLLSQHPQVAAELLDELEQVLAGDAPTVAQLDQLPLLDRVIKESMRIIPVAPGVFRRPAEDVELGGYLVPAHTAIFTSTYATHHMPELYPEPERFLPQRWETITPSPYEYSPFSVGARMCIGATFAVFELKIVLAMLLQRYRLELLAGTGVDRQGFITISPRGGLPMLVCRQDRQFARGVGGVHGNVREMVELPA